MDTKGIPDLLIMGDSHTAALDLAVRDDVFTTSLLYIKGNHWHEGGFEHHKLAGIARPGSAYVRRKVARVRVEMGGQLFQKDRVVLASIGYHLGRFCPAMTRRGHTVDEAAFGANLDARFMSTAMMEGVVNAKRAPLWDMLSEVANECVLVVVAPPILSNDLLSWQAAPFVTRSLRERGVMVWDPREQTGRMSQPLSDAWRTDDGVHGNMQYGRAVLDGIFPQAVAECA